MCFYQILFNIFLINDQFCIKHILILYKSTLLYGTYVTMNFSILVHLLAPSFHHVLLASENFKYYHIHGFCLALSQCRKILQRKDQLMYFVKFFQQIVFEEIRIPLKKNMQHKRALYNSYISLECSAVVVFTREKSIGRSYRLWF